jgi:hypothetical protein
MLFDIVFIPKRKACVKDLSMFSRLSSALNKGSKLLLGNKLEMRYTSLVEVNQAVKAWSY